MNWSRLKFRAWINDNSTIKQLNCPNRNKICGYGCFEMHLSVKWLEEMGIGGGGGSTMNLAILLTYSTAFLLQF